MVAEGRQEEKSWFSRLLEGDFFSVGLLHGCDSATESPETACGCCVVTVSDALETGDYVLAPGNVLGRVVEVDLSRGLLPLKVQTSDGEARWYSENKLARMQMQAWQIAKFEAEVGVAGPVAAGAKQGFMADETMTMPGEEAKAIAELIEKSSDTSKGSHEGAGSHPLRESEAQGQHDRPIVPARSGRASDDRKKNPVQDVLKARIAAAAAATAEAAAAAAKVRVVEERQRELLKQQQLEEQHNSPRGAPAWQMFTITVHKRHRDRLGIDIAQIDDGKSLLIEGISGDGLIGWWNAQHPAQPVFLGDRIVEINGARNDVVGLVEAARQTGVLCITLRRELHTGLHPVAHHPAEQLHLDTSRSLGGGYVSSGPAPGGGFGGDDFDPNAVVQEDRAAQPPDRLSGPKWEAFTDVAEDPVPPVACNPGPRKQPAGGPAGAAPAAIVRLPPPATATTSIVATPAQPGGSVMKEGEAVVSSVGGAVAQPKDDAMAQSLGAGMAANMAPMAEVSAHAGVASPAQEDGSARSGVGVERSTIDLATGDEPDAADGAEETLTYAGLATALGAVTAPLDFEADQGKGSELLGPGDAAPADAAAAGGDNSPITFGAWARVDAASFPFDDLLADDVCATTGPTPCEAEQRKDVGPLPLGSGAPASATAASTDGGVARPGACAQVDASSPFADLLAEDARAKAEQSNASEILGLGGAAPADAAVASEGGGFLALDACAKVDASSPFAELLAEDARAKQGSAQSEAEPSKAAVILFPGAAAPGGVAVSSAAGGPGELGACAQLDVSSPFADLLAEDARAKTGPTPCQASVDLVAAADAAAGSPPHVQVPTLLGEDIF